MANRNEKLPGNAPGTFYVDQSCVDCDICRNTAPKVFRRDDEMGLSVVYQQPVDAEDFILAREAAIGCPTESIGMDG